MCACLTSYKLCVNKCVCAVNACICLCVHVCICLRVCVGKARIGVPAGTTLVNNGSFILPEHLTGLCVATATHTQTQSLRGNTHTEGFTHSFAKSLGYSLGVSFHLH